MMLPKQRPPVNRQPSGRAVLTAQQKFDRSFPDVRLVFDMNRISGPAIRYEPVERACNAPR